MKLFDELPDVFREMLPALMPLFLGYAMAAWMGVQSNVLRPLIRNALFPILLFSTLAHDTSRTFLTAAAVVGVVLGLVGVFSRRWIKVPVAPSAGIPNIACFGLPFFMLSLNGKTSGEMTAGIIFVALAVTVSLVEPGQQGAKALFRQPWMMAAIVAAVFVFGDVSQKYISRGLQPLVEAARPVLLVYLGACLHPLASLFNSKVWPSIAFRLITGLVIGGLATWKFGKYFSTDAEEAIILAALSPPATRGAALITDGGGDSEHSVVAAGTIASLIALIVKLVYF